MNTKEFKLLAKDSLFNAKVVVGDYKSVGVGTIILNFKEDHIQVSSDSGFRVKAIFDMTYDSIDQVQLKIRRGADMAKRSDRPLVHYIFEGQMNILLNNDEIYKLIIKDCQGLDVLAKFLESKHVEIEDEINQEAHVLDLVKASYSANEQYDVLNKHADLFNKTDKDYYNEKII